MEMAEYINSARGHLIAQEDKGAVECYLEEMIQGTTMKQKAYDNWSPLSCTRKR